MKGKNLIILETLDKFFKIQKEDTTRVVKIELVKTLIVKNSCICLRFTKLLRNYFHLDLGV